MSVRDATILTEEIDRIVAVMRESIEAAIADLDREGIAFAAGG